MAGATSNLKPSSHTKPPPSSSASAKIRKSRWDHSSSGATSNSPSTDPKRKPHPNPNPNPNPSPASAIHHNRTFQAPPPPAPSYNFHMLERRTITLADGSARTYWALPPDYQNFPSLPRFFPRPLPLGAPPGPMSPAPGPSRQLDYWNSLGLDGGAAKRKLPEQEIEDPRGNKFSRTGNGNRRQSEVVTVATKHSEVDQVELKKAFLRFMKTVNETPKEKKAYLENGKHGRLPCVACGRPNKEYPDTHSLVLHCYNSDKTDLRVRVDHLALHKALCVLMGWNFSVSPDNSKAYQFLSPEEADEKRDDLVMWPPMVIVHNTITGKSKEGRMEGLGNKLMDTKIRDLGFPGGKSKSLYGREGHLGITLIRFSGDQAGLKEAQRLADHFERKNLGRKAWAKLQPLMLGSKEDENNPHLMGSDGKTPEKKRILYGYLLNAGDMDKIDFDTKKKVLIESRSDYSR